MKKLLLIRHAKATHKPDYADFDRPLKGEGRQDSVTMAGRLKAAGIIPQLFVASSSVRTLETAGIIAEELGVKPIILDKAIYEGSVQTLLGIINQQSDDLELIALVGHNPDISYLVYHLTSEMRELSPGTAALISFEVGSWGYISEYSGSLAWYSSPKDEA